MAFEWKELLKRFHYTQYDERKLIRDLQLQVDDLNANLKRIASQFGSDDERITALEDGGDPVDAYTKTETDALLAPKITLPQARLIMAADSPVVVSNNWDDPADRIPGVSPKVYTENGTGGPTPLGSPLSLYYRLRISSASSNAAIEYAIPMSIGAGSYSRIEIGGFYGPWLLSLDGSRYRFYADRGGAGDVTVNTVYRPTRILHNFGGVYSSTTGRFTCSKAGEYSVGFKGMGGNPGTAKPAFFKLMKNAELVSESHDGSTTYSMHYLTYQGPCAVGDYFTVVVGANYAQFVDGTTRFFNAFWADRIA